MDDKVESVFVEIRRLDNGFTVELSVYGENSRRLRGASIISDRETDAIQSAKDMFNNL